MTSTFSIGERDTEPIVLTALEFDVLWEHMRLGQLPLVVKVPSPGKTTEERARFEEQAWSALEERGLGRPVDLNPEIEDLLPVLAAPEREVDARAYAGRSLRVLAAAKGDLAAVAVLSDDEVRLRRASVTGLAAAVLAELPGAPAGAGRSVALPTEEFEKAAHGAEGTQEGFLKSLLEHGVRTEDAQALAEMIKDVAAMGNFGAAARDKFGRRRRAERVVSFFDTEDGRYVQIRRPAQDGTPWTTIAPADPRNLAHHVDELLAEIVREVAP